MADPGPFLPVSNTGYVPLPGSSGPDSGSEASRRSFKEQLIVVSGFFALCFFVAFVGFRGSQNVHVNDQNPNLYRLPPEADAKPQILWPLSRGPAAGVSEKSNLFLGRDLPTYSWDNSVLSWERTAFHFQPEKNWMNDPNGPMFYKGWYHFFYQYNPNGAVWGDIVWGHAVSRDLIHWLHLPLAMVADQWYDSNGVWTGSATLLPDGGIVMLYTGSTNESVQVQNLAYPSDPSDPLLLRWVKYPGNPVLVPPPGINKKDFRDPTTAWLTSDGKWRITIGSKMNKTGMALVYETRDFKTYEQLEGFLHAVPGTGMWECVDFFPVSKTDENGLDTSIKGPGVKHVVKVSLDDTRRDHYAIGTYDDKTGTWIPDDPSNDVGIGGRLDYGVFYASKTFYDQNKGRRVLWGWIGESDSEAADIRKGWASVQSIPRTVVLDKKIGSNLVQWPVKEVESLRLQGHEFSQVGVQAGSVVPLDVGPAAQLDIVAEFEIEKEAIDRASESEEHLTCNSAATRGALGPFGVVVLADDKLTEQTPVFFYVWKGAGGKLRTLFCSDQTRSSKATDVNKPIYGSSVRVLDGEKFSVRILVDHSIVESFGQGGRACITSRVYPTKAVYEAARVFVFNNATEANVKASLKIWQMNSAFIRPYPQSQLY